MLGDLHSSLWEGFLITRWEWERPLGPSYCGTPPVRAASVLTELEREHTAAAPAGCLGHAFGKGNRSVPVLASANLTLKSWQWKAALLILPAQSIQKSCVNQMRYNISNVEILEKLYIYIRLIFISLLGCSFGGTGFQTLSYTHDHG